MRGRPNEWTKSVFGGFFGYFSGWALMMFTLADATSFSDNLIHPAAVAAGLGTAGGYAAALALILSSVATLETTMLQFSRTLFAMGRDHALPNYFGQVHERTVTPVRTMYLLLAIGLAMIFISSFLPSIGTILNDSVAAIAVQVCYYYGLAGLVCAWSCRGSFRTSMATWTGYVLYPALSALSLFALGVYAFIGYNTTVKIVGLGGLLIGIIFYRPSGWGRKIKNILAEE